MGVVVNLSPETARYIEEAQAQGVDVDSLISITLEQALLLPSVHADLAALQSEAHQLDQSPEAWRRAFEAREAWLKAHPLPTLQDDSLSRESIYGDRL